MDHEIYLALVQLDEEVKSLIQKIEEFDNRFKVIEKKVGLKRKDGTGKKSKKKE